MREGLITLAGVLVAGVGGALIGLFGYELTGSIISLIVTVPLSFMFGRMCGKVIYDYI